MLHVTVDSQTIELGSDDTSNGYSERTDSEWQESDDNDVNADASNDKIDGYYRLINKLEVRKNMKAKQAHESIVTNESLLNNENQANESIEISDSLSDNANEANELNRINDIGPEMEDEEWPIDRWLRLREEEEADTRGRLTAPRNEVRKRQPKKKPANKNELQFNELRIKQNALVDEQIALQKIQKEIAELELKEKKEIAPIAKEEAQERLRLLKMQCEIAEIDLINKKSQS